MRNLLVLTLVSLAVTACSDGDDPTPPVPISGFVHAGPTCPVVQDPPDPACEDRPVPGASIDFTDSQGRVAETVTSDAEGRFSLGLQPGSYTMVPQPVDGLLGTADPFPFNAVADPVTLDVAHDTGIR